MEFADAVRDSCRLLADLGGTPEQNEHLLSGDRLDEAAAVDDLVQRYATAEVSGIPIGRVATSKVITPLGDLLSKSLSRADDATKAAVRDAVVKAIARAYAATTGLDYTNETKVSRQRTSRAIWNFWIPRIYTGYMRKASGVSEQETNTVQNLGAAALKEGLKGVRLGRKGRSRKIELAGIGYGVAGTVLRLAQSEITPNELVAQPPPEVQILWRNEWPMDEFLP